MLLDRTYLIFQVELLTFMKSSSRVHRPPSSLARADVFASSGSSHPPSPFGDWYSYLASTNRPLSKCFPFARVLVMNLSKLILIRIKVSHVAPDPQCPQLVVADKILSLSPSPNFFWCTKNQLIIRMQFNHWKLRFQNWIDMSAISSLIHTPMFNVNLLFLFSDESRV